MRLLLIVLSFFNLIQCFGQTHFYRTWKSPEGMTLQVRTEAKDGWGEPKNLSKTYDSIESLHLACDPKQLRDVYLIFKNQGKMGILNSKGKVEFPAIYENIYRVGPWHEYGGVSVFDSRYFILIKDGRSSILKAKNLKKFTKETFIKVESDFQNGDLICYEEDRVKYICQTGEVLMPDIKFKEIKQVFGPNIYNDNDYAPPHTILAKEEGNPLQIYSTQFSFTNATNADLTDFGILYFNRQEKLFVRASLDGKIGVLDGEGNIQIPFKYDDLEVIVRYLHDTLYHRFITVKDGKEGLIDLNNNEIYPTEFSQGTFTGHRHDFRDSLFIVQKDSSTQQGLVDIVGNVLIPVQLQTIRELHSNGQYDKRYFEVKRDNRPGMYTEQNKVGIYDASGLEIVPCKYYMIYDENALDPNATSPNFIKFNSYQERSNYLEKH